MAQFLIETVEQLENFLSSVDSETVIAVDTETNMTNSFHNRRMIGMSLSSKQYSAYLPVRHEDSPLGPATNLNIRQVEPLLSAFFMTDRKYIFHNAKFDLHVLNKESIHLPSFIEDTMLISYMLNENGTHKLKELGVIYLDPDAADEQKVLKILKKGFTWEQTPTGLMGQYACKDTELTLALWEELYPSLSEWEGYEALYRREIEFMWLLFRMEEQGVLIDKDQARQLANAAVKEIDQIESELGFDPAKRLALAHRLYSKPPAGLGLVPGELGKPSKSFPQGVPIMNEAELLRHKVPDVDKVLRHRELVKRKSVWYQGWFDKADPTGRLHPSFRQHGTRTTRLSCTDPNMQQVPRDATPGSPRTLLRAPQGHALVEYDYSQAEFRLGAVYAAQPAILEGLRRGEDFHSITANDLGIDRQIAKTVNFLILYGGGARKLSDTLGVGYNVAKSYLDKFHKNYPEFGPVMERASLTAQANGYVRLWTGRRRHFEFSWEYHKAFNSVIQGGVAEIVKDTILRLSKVGIVPVCTVHDSLWIELRQEEVEERSAQIMEIMEWPTASFGCPFPVDKKVLANG